MQPPEDRRRAERFVLSVAYSPDGKRLACGAMDGSVAVFDTATGNTVGVLEGHYKPVRSLTFMPGAVLTPGKSDVCVDKGEPPRKSDWCDLCLRARMLLVPPVPYPPYPDPPTRLPCRLEDAAHCL